MVKKCDISGTGVMSGNNVSHANNRTRRRFMPNLQVVSLYSEALNQTFKLKVCVKTLRSIEHNGGLDGYLEATSGNKLTLEAQKIKKALIAKKGPVAKPAEKAAPKAKPARVAKAESKKAAK